LRSWLKAFQPWIALKRGRRRKLKRLARSTSLARDAEVGLAWLAAVRSTLDPRARPGAEQLAVELTALRDGCYSEVHEAFPDRWRRLSRKLARGLARAGEERSGGRDFQSAYAAALRSRLTGLMEAWEEARDGPEVQAIHRLRIEGKKVRYLVEAILPWHPAAEPLVMELRRQQDAAGVVQDLRRLHELSETALLHGVSAGYKRMLAAFADAEAEEQRLRRLRHGETLSPRLWLARAIAQAQSLRIAGFKKRYLGKRPPICIDQSYALLDELKGEPHPLKTKRRAARRR
jgi:CHAD domain-containing protein